MSEEELSGSQTIVMGPSEDASVFSGATAPEEVLPAADPPAVQPIRGAIAPATKRTAPPLTKLRRLSAMPFMFYLSSHDSKVADDDVGEVATPDGDDEEQS